MSTANTEADLCNEFQAFCTKEGLPQMSADELIHEDLNGDQRRYVSRFIERWEAAVYPERGAN